MSTENNSSNSQDKWQLFSPDKIHPVFPVTEDGEAPEFAHLKTRILEKKADYRKYNFSAQQSTALNIFFDLAQEFYGTQELYSICVLIPKVLFELESRIFFLDEKGQLSLRASTVSTESKDYLEPLMPKDNQPLFHENHFYLPIKANQEIVKLLPYDPIDHIIGLFDIFPADEILDGNRSFFEKYVNRIGYRLHYQIILTKNTEHIQFIKSLVKDFGHNIIVPNMYFKLYFNHIRKYLEQLETLIKKSFRNIYPKVQDHDFKKEIVEYHCNIRAALKKTKDEFNETVSHYENKSMFMETLLRESHFNAGRYVLEKKLCNIQKEIIDPQLKQFERQFEESGIEIDLSLGGIPDREIEISVDIGLISQVYANLFSNVLKYAQRIYDPGQNRNRKFVAWGCEIDPNYFGTGRAGLKLNVFSSGQNISMLKAGGLFCDDSRGENVRSQAGSGHGLFFVKEIVELHGGKVGYEPTPLGNNFYFVLPMYADKPESSI